MLTNTRAHQHAGAATTTWRTWAGYIVHIAIVLICGGIAFFTGPSIPDIMKAVAAIPGMASLISIPWQLFRDERAHDRAKELADRHSALELGVNSSIAKVAFDNFVIFASEYTEKLQEAISDIVRNGARGGMTDLPWPLCKYGSSTPYGCPMIPTRCCRKLSVRSGKWPPMPITQKLRTAEALVGLPPMKKHTWAFVGYQDSSIHPSTKMWISRWTTRKPMCEPSSLLMCEKS